MSTITFQCYSCQKTLRVGADKAGKKAKCVQCGTILTIPMASAEEEEVVVAEIESEPPARTKPPPPPSRSRDDDDEDDTRPRARRKRDEDDDDDRPRRRRREEEDDVERPRRRRDADDYDDDDDRPRKRRRDDDEDDDWDRKKTSTAGWPKVRVGLLLAFIGFCVMAGGYGGQGIGNLLFRVRAPSAGNVIFQLGVVVEVAGVITAVVGFVFWLFVPKKHGLLGFAIACLAVNGSYLLLQFISRLVPALNSFGGGGRFGIDDALVIISHVVNGNSNLFSFIRGSTAAYIINVVLSQALVAAAFIMVAFYLLALGKTFKDRRLTSKASFLIILSGCTSGFWVLFGILFAIFINNPSRAFDIILGLLQLAGFGAMVFQYVMFLLALHYARKTVD